jgi:CPA1 family monovalent cation:H+ antiporter
MSPRRFIADGRVERTVALLTPFAVYIPADAIGVSGVLAAVAAGLYIGQQSPVANGSAVRRRVAAVWELGTFLLNGLVFILFGLSGWSFATFCTILPPSRRPSLRATSRWSARR